MSSERSIVVYVTEQRNETDAEMRQKTRQERGLSLVGRAPALHAGGQEFDSPSLHQYELSLSKSLEVFLINKASKCTVY